MTKPIPDWLTARPIAHRGRHSLPGTPENSHAAFAAAIAESYPIEIDVRLIGDGNVIVFHDNDLQRLTGASGLAKEKTLEEVRPLRLLGTDEPVPLFSETLAFVAGRSPLLVEIKSDAETFEELARGTLDALKGYDGPFAMQSFHVPTVTYLATHAPEVVRGQLASGDGWQKGYEEAPLPDFFAYNINFLPTPLTTTHREQGIPLIAWTVQNPNQQEKAGQVADNFIFDAIFP